MVASCASAPLMRTSKVERVLLLSLDGAVARSHKTLKFRIK